MTAQEPVRLAVLGGNNRGQSFDQHLTELDGRIELVAICDPIPGVLDSWQVRHPGIARFTDYPTLLVEGHFEAVYIATPLLMHAAQTVAALEHGKHVLVEVPAACTVAECDQIVATVHRTGLKFMMAENYSYARESRLVAHLVGRGSFGPLVSAEGSYIHDLRPLMHRADGTLSWRGELQRDWNSASYPTHALGPLHTWLEAASAPTEYASLVASSTRSAALPHYFAVHFGTDHPGASPDFWRHGDSVVTLIKTVDGTLITLRVDMVSARPYDTMHTGLQGLTGAYLSGRHALESSLVWLDPAAGPSGPGDWHPVDDLAHEVRDHRWESLAGSDLPEHQLWDRFVLEDFVDYIRDDRPPPFGVEAAAMLSSVIPLSEASLAAGGAVMEFPQFGRVGSGPS